MQAISQHWRCLAFAATVSMALPAAAQEPAARPSFSWNPSAIKSIIFPSKSKEGVSTPVEVEPRNAPVARRAPSPQVVAETPRSVPTSPAPPNTSSLRSTRVGVAGATAESAAVRPQPATTSPPAARPPAGRRAPAASPASLQPTAVVPLAENPLASPLNRSRAKPSPSFEEAYRNALDGAVVIPEQLEIHEPVTAEYEEELISSPPPAPPKENLAPIVSAAGRARPAGLKKRAAKPAPALPKSSPPAANSSSRAARPVDQPASFVAHYPSTATPLGPTARQVAAKAEPKSESVSTVSAKLGLPEFEASKVESATLELRKVETEEEAEAAESPQPSAAEKEEEKSRPKFAFPKKLLNPKNNDEEALAASGESNVPKLLSAADRKVEASSAAPEKPAELLVKPAFVVTGGEK